MYDKNTIKSLIQTSKNLESVMLPRSLSNTGKIKVIDSFNKSVKTMINTHEIVLVAIKM